MSYFRHLLSSNPFHYFVNVNFTNGDTNTFTGCTVHAFLFCSKELVWFLVFGKHHYHYHVACRTSTWMLRSPIQYLCQHMATDRVLCWLIRCAPSIAFILHFIPYSTICHGTIFTLYSGLLSVYSAVMSSNS